MPLLIRIKKTVEKVMIPNPPIWKRKMVITWPNVLKSFPISMTTKPVTQTAEVEEKSASMKRRCPWDAEKGNQRRIPPVRITAAKLRIKILEGERRLEKKFLILIWTFIGLDTSKTISHAKIDSTQKYLPCQSKPPHISNSR